MISKYKLLCFFSLLIINALLIVVLTNFDSFRIAKLRIHFPQQNAVTLDQVNMDTLPSNMNLNQSEVPQSTVFHIQKETQGRLATIQNYVVYYGTGRLDDLMKYDLAIIQPNTLNPEEIQSLHSQGTAVIAYLSIGEVESYRDWYGDGRFNMDWILGLNENWGSYFVDVSQSGWQDLMNDVTAEYLSLGFDGIFLDTVDTVDLFPTTEDSMVALIASLRFNYPDAIIVQNRGFKVLDRTASYIDAVMFEGLSTNYNFTDGIYATSLNYSRAEMLYGFEIPVLSLDYTSITTPSMARRAQWIAHQYGFIPAVSEISLQSIPDFNLLESAELQSTSDLSIISQIDESDNGERNLIIRVDNLGNGAAFDLVIDAKINGRVFLTETYLEILPTQTIEWIIPLGGLNGEFSASVSSLEIPIPEYE